MDKQVEILITDLKLKAFAHNYQEYEQQAIDNSWSYIKYLLKLCQLELARRYQNRIKTWNKESYW